MGLLVAMVLAGCGGSTDGAGSEETDATLLEAPPLPAEIKVALDGYEGAENVGLLMADKRGYFDDVGLNVWLGAPLLPRSTAFYVATRTDELGVAQLPQVAIARDNGLPLVAVGSVIPQPTAAMIWLRGSGVRAIADLRGKTIGVPGVPFQKALLQIVLEDAGLTPEDVRIEPVGYKLVPALLKGRVDAIFGGSENVEGAALEARGAEPVIKPVQSLGIPAYDELVVITRDDRAAADPQAIRAFMAAVRRGTVAALKDPKGAAKVIQQSDESDPESTRRDTEAQLKATLPLLSRTGKLDAERAADFLDWMHERGLLKRPMPVSDLLLDERPPQP